MVIKRIVQILSCQAMLLLVLISTFSTHLVLGFGANSKTSPIITSAVLRVTYDGTLFHGWSASNDGNVANLPIDGQSALNRRGRSRRNRNRPAIKKGEVRSVQGTLRYALAKIYGNVDVRRIVVEGSSRTDAGVSARHMIALIYCLCEDEEAAGENKGTLAIEGKRLPHPATPTDDGFKPLPFESDLTKMVYALNKMLPPDIQLADASSTPTINRNFEDKQGEEEGERNIPFHPSLNTISKTYSYTFSAGDLYDPVRCR